VRAGYQVLVKLHENSLDPSLENSGGVDWVATAPAPARRHGGGHLITSDASPWLVAADVLITDHSSIGFEYLLLDRPVIRVVMPELIGSTNVGAEYVELMETAATSVTTAPDVLAAVGRAFADPARLSAERRAVASELFHNPGRATECAVAELYDLMELPAPARAVELGAVVTTHG
jgi:CDP-glycerol glycerophosphotransferase (TagB/SpsB family)